MRRNPVRLPVLLILVSLIAACSSTGEKMPAGNQTTSAQAPAWFTQLTQQPGRLLGYGRGESRNIARQNALAEIAQQFEVEVKSTVSSDLSVVDDKVMRSDSKRIKLATNQKLKHARIIKEEEIKGTVYIAAEVDMRPAEKILAEDLLEQWGSKPTAIKWKGHKWLANSIFVHKLNRQITSPDGSGVKNVDISLTRKNKTWFLNLDDNVIPLNELDLPNLIAWENTNALDFVIFASPEKSTQQKNRLKHGEAFMLEVEAINPTGFYTLFNIYPNGNTVLVQDSKTLESLQSFPTEAMRKEGLHMYAETLERGKPSRDVFLAIRSSKKLDTSLFEAISESQAKNTFHLHTLLDMLQQPSIVDIAVARVNIQP